MHAERLLYSICVPSLVLIAQPVFLLQCGQTDRQTSKQTDATEHPTHAGGYTADVGNERRYGEKKFFKNLAPAGFQLGIYGTASHDAIRPQNHWHAWQSVTKSKLDRHKLQIFISVILELKIYSENNELDAWQNSA